MRVADDWLPEEVVKSSCGIFGMLRKDLSEKISVEMAVRGIESVRYRGSRLGAGFSAFNLATDAPLQLQAFVQSEENVSLIRGMLHSVNVTILDEEVPTFGKGEFKTYQASLEAGDDIEKAIDELNAEFAAGGQYRARIYCCSRYQRVFKGVGYPKDVARDTKIRSACRSADLWLAHTRQPTNSPGALPIWSHPFAASEWSVAHNGDISSFGANFQFLKSVGVRSLVGTDSEAIAFLLDYLTRTRGLSITEAAEVLTPTYEGRSSQVVRSSEYGGCHLDGPYSVVAGYCDGDDVYLLGLVDRSKFRPMVVGEDAGHYFVASEESQIRALSPDAECWRPSSGSFVLFSMRHGVIESGRRARESFANIGTEKQIHSILASERTHNELNDEIADRFGSSSVVSVGEVLGHRFLGTGLRSGQELFIDGSPGNCLGNLLEGGKIIVNGNAADDVGDTMHGGTIVIRGDAGDVVGQAMQGGMILVSGSAGNRVGIQMRAYEGTGPALVVGGTAGDYLGEYMGGGTIAVLNLNEEQIFSKQVATGMVGGRIYVRGMIPPDAIGLQPKRADVENYLVSLCEEGALEERVLDRARSSDYSLEALLEILPEKVALSVRRFYLGKYSSCIKTEYRPLESSDFTFLKPAFEAYAREIGRAEKLEGALDDRFTVITVADSLKSQAVVEE